MFIRDAQLGFGVNNNNIIAFSQQDSIERMRIDSSGNINIYQNLDVSAGVAIGGSNAFYLPSTNVDAGNSTNTYINFKQAGTNNDWCYLRQIGGDNVIKLVFDFLDDSNDARFGIRSVVPNAGSDSIKEIFLVDGDYCYTNGLRLSGLDTANTLWQQTGD